MTLYLVRRRRYCQPFDAHSVGRPHIRGAYGGPQRRRLRFVYWRKWFTTYPGPFLSGRSG